MYQMEQGKNTFLSALYEKPNIILRCTWRPRRPSCPRPPREINDFSSSFFQIASRKFFESLNTKRTSKKTPNCPGIIYCTVRSVRILGNSMIKENLSSLKFVDDFFQQYDHFPYSVKMLVNIPNSISGCDIANCHNSLRAAVGFCS